MPRDYQKGDDYSLYYNTSGIIGSPEWERVPAADNLAVDPAPSDIEVPERGRSTGHMQGDGDPSITFTLMEDAGDANVDALIAAIHSGAAVHIAVGAGASKPYWHMEACLVGTAFSAGRGEPAQFDVEAKVHANASIDFAYAASLSLT